MVKILISVAISNTSYNND